MSAIRAATNSFRARLALGYAVVLLMLAGVWAWSLYGPITKGAIDQQRSHLETMARVAAASLGSPSTDRSQVVDALARHGDIRLTLIAADGTVLADSEEEPARMENHRDRPEVRRALRGLIGSDTRRSSTLGIRLMYVAVPAELDGEPAVVRIAEPLARIQEVAETGRNTGLLLLLVSLIAAAAVAAKLSATAADPVLRLRDAAEGMAAGDLRTAMPFFDGDVGDLATSLEALRNRMRSTIEQLQEGQETLRTALDGLEDAVYVMEDGRLEFANAAAGAMFRMPPRGRAGAALEDTGLPESVLEAVRNGLAAHAARAVEIGPDPNRRYFRISTVPLAAGDDGSPRALVVVSDITGVRSLDAVRRDFVANASHELKTPASAIQLLADSAGAAAADNDTAQALAFIGSMKAEASRLTRLVSDLLDLSRLERPGRARETTDVRMAVADALAAHRPAATAAGLDLGGDLDKVSGEDVYAAIDGTDLAVILDNLVANAIAYTSEGAVTVRVTADPSTVSVDVADTGTGIAAEHLQRVFERFYRVDAARSRDSGGTGLGLSLVRNAVERWGGSVELVSEEGRGTTATVRLPRAT